MRFIYQLPVTALAVLAAPGIIAQEMTLSDLGTSPYYEQEIDDENRTGPKFAPYDNDSFTDIRLVVLSMDRGDYRIGRSVLGSETTYSGSFAEASRISVLAIHPLCGYAPINCFTPSTMKSNERPPAARLIGTRDSFDWLVGVEFFYVNWAEDQDVASSSPEITVTSLGVDLHLFGLGVETKSPIPLLPGRISLEGTPFVGLGYSMAEYSDYNGNKADDTGIYSEFGLRVALLGTYTWGLQIGAEARWIWAEANIDLPGTTDSTFKSNGLAFGGSIGWRF